MRSTSSPRRSSERFAQQRLAAQALKQRYSEPLAARTFGVRRLPAPSGTDDLKRECCRVGGNQAPKISFATVTADIVWGQPA